MWKSKWSGFTLIEMLITVGIMAVIASGVTVMIGPGPKRTARDGQRKSDLERIRSEIEIYRNTSLSMSYPPCTGGAAWCNVSAIAGGFAMTGGIPGDPTSGQNYAYGPTSSGCAGTAASRCTGYVICAALEKDTTAAAVCSGASCGGTCSYGVRSP